MNLELVTLSAANFHRLYELEPTPGVPDPWVSEVEDFIFGPAIGTHLDEPASHIVLAVDEHQPVGVFVHHPHDSYPGAEYISAVLVDHRLRGRGYGAMVLSAAVDHAITVGARAHAVWAVHSDNALMLKLSSALGEQLAVDADSAYRFFVHP